MFFSGILRLPGQARGPAYVQIVNDGDKLKSNFYSLMKRQKKDGIPHRMQIMMERQRETTKRTRSLLHRVYFTRWQFTKYVTEVVKFAKAKFQQEQIIDSEPRFTSLKQVRAKSLTELKVDVLKMEKGVIEKRQKVLECFSKVSNYKAEAILRDVEAAIGNTGKCPDVVLNASQFIKRMSMKNWPQNDAMILRERILEYLRAGVKLVRAQSALDEAPSEGFTSKELLAMAGITSDSEVENIMGKITKQVAEESNAAAELAVAQEKMLQSSNMAAATSTKPVVNKPIKKTVSIKSRPLRKS